MVHFHSVVPKIPIFSIKNHKICSLYMLKAMKAKPYNTQCTGQQSALSCLIIIPTKQTRNLVPLGEDSDRSARIINDLAESRQTHY